MKLIWNVRHLAILVVAMCLSIAGANTASAEIAIPTVSVDNIGNAASSYGWGRVDYSYRIAKYDVTAAQYTVFLNAVAATDTNGLYNASMATDTSFGCGISRSGISGSYTYATTKNPSFPVNYTAVG